MLTQEFEDAVRTSIHPCWAKHKEILSHERTALLGEIDRLRAELSSIQPYRNETNLTKKQSLPIL